MRQVVAGKNHFLALTIAGDLYAWGDNSCYQLGLDPNNLVTVTSPAGDVVSRVDNVEEEGEITYDNEGSQSDRSPMSRPSSAQSRKKVSENPKKVLKMAKIPYLVKPDDYSDSTTRDDLKTERQKEVKANKFELVACGDYNSYAVLNI